MHRVGVMRRVALQFVKRGLSVVIGDQALVAVAEINGAEIGYEDEAVSAQVEIAMNGLAHHAAHIGTAGVEPSIVHLAGDRRAADLLIRLEHQHLLARFREQCRTDKAVVAGSDNNGVVVCLVPLAGISALSLVLKLACSRNINST